MNPEDIVVAVTSFPGDQDADEFARALVGERLIACANIIPGVQSIYWWKDTITADREQIIVMKTRRDNIERLKDVVKSRHPYDVPELMVFEISGALLPYLEWVRTESRAVRRM